MYAGRYTVKSGFDVPEYAICPCRRPGIRGPVNHGRYSTKASRISSGTKANREIKSAKESANHPASEANGQAGTTRGACSFSSSSDHPANSAYRSAPIMDTADYFVVGYCFVIVGVLIYWVREL